MRPCYLRSRGARACDGPMCPVSVRWWGPGAAARTGARRVGTECSSPPAKQQGPGVEASVDGALISAQGRASAACGVEFSCSFWCDLLCLFLTRWPLGRDASALVWCSAPRTGMASVARGRQHMSWLWLAFSALFALPLHEACCSLLCAFTEKGVHAWSESGQTAASARTIESQELARRPHERVAKLSGACIVDMCLGAARPSHGSDQGPGMWNCPNMS